MKAKDKKQLKTEAKALKKKLKARAKLSKTPSANTPSQEAPDQSSRLVRSAEMVRGIIFLILSVSLAVAAILSHKGYIITLEDIFESLAAVIVGKVVLLIIAVAFFVIGLKHLRAVK